MPIPTQWLRPEGLPTGVHAVFTTRDGGVSAAPWQSLNLGDHVGDDPQAVARNRTRVAQAVGVPLGFAKQVHGVALAPCPRPGEAVPEADALWTDQPGLACVMMVADCLPVLWSDDRGEVVAASHAGWRGLLGQGGAGILETTWAGLRALRPQAQWHAWLGPCIGPRAFEVGAEVRDAFVADAPSAAPRFRPSPWHDHRFVADLPGMARDRLARLGVHQVWGNDGSDDWCTVTQSQRFFSHRREGQTPGHPAGTGRMAAIIWR